MEDESSLTTGFAFDGDWKSEIGPVSSRVHEGNFVSLVEDSATGAIKGDFAPPSGGNPRSAILGGKHEPPSGGRPKHRVTIIRDDGADVYIYTGLVTDQGGGVFKANGRRMKVTKPVSLTPLRSGDATAEAAAEEVAAAALVFADDEWVGTRPPT